jgi:hypothetical protein
LIGFSTIWTAAAQNWQKYTVRGALTACMAVPWLIAIETVHGDSAYGPGFPCREAWSRGRALDRDLLAAGGFLPR